MNSARRRLRAHCILACVATSALLLHFAPLARAFWLGPSEWPVERLVRNVEARLVEHPDDLDLLYTLGRIHALAFTLESNALAVKDSRVVDPALFTDDIQKHFFSPGGRKRKSGDTPSSSELRLHLEAAIRTLTRAIERAPERGLHALTLACVLEAGAPRASEVDTVALLVGEPAQLEASEETAIASWIERLGAADDHEAEAALRARLERALPALNEARMTSDATRRSRVAALLELTWRERAIAGYRRAFDLSFEADLARGRIDGSIWSCSIDLAVSGEAGKSWARLVRARGVNGATEEALLAETEEKLAALAALPCVSDITPIVLSLDACKSLDELIAPELSVPFDLDGDAVDELWPWIAPGTGWLVWDPKHTGVITSGRQLFGSASGWFFFPDGYRVLDALDDDRNGELRGAELLGLSVWFDRDLDGVSDRGEVVPVETLGIVALATEATERIGVSLGNPCGVELADGRVLPTYDWVLQSKEP